MAPRPPEGKQQYLARLRAAARRGDARVPFGEHHFSHVSCLEDGTWRLRRWVLDEQKADEYRAQHRSFMPENAEALSGPGPDVLLEGRTLDEYIASLDRHWPLRA